MKISTSLELVRYIRHHLAGSEFQDVKAVEDFVDAKLVQQTARIQELEGYLRNLKTHYPSMKFTLSDFGIKDHESIQP